MLSHHEAYEFSGYGSFSILLKAASYYCYQEKKKEQFLLYKNKYQNVIETNLTNVTKMSYHVPVDQEKYSYEKI